MDNASNAGRPIDRRIKPLRWLSALLFAAALAGIAVQLLPPTALVTVRDGAVVTIFVVDLGLIIMEHLRQKDHELP